MFTPVAEYKLKGGDSRPALTIMNYTELADEKNVRFLATCIFDY